MLDRLGVFPREIRFGGIPHGRAFDLGDVVTGDILWLQRQGQYHHGVFGKPVEEREDMVTGLALRGHVAHLRRPTQALNSDHAVRQVVEPPGGRGIVRTWRGECQGFCEIMAKRQILIARIGRDLQQLVGIAAGDLGFRVEPFEQPVIEVLSGAAAYPDPRRGQ